MGGDTPPADACWSAGSFDDHWRREVDGACGAVALPAVEVDQFAGSFVQTDLEPLLLAEPAIELCFSDPVTQVGDDRHQPWPRASIDAQAGAPDVPLTEIVWDVLGSSRCQRIVTVQPVEAPSWSQRSLRVAAGSAVISVVDHAARGGMDGGARHNGPGCREPGGAQGRPGGGDRRQIDAVPAPGLPGRGGGRGYRVLAPHAR